MGLKEVILERMQIGLNQMVSSDVLSNLRAHIEYTADYCAIELRTFVWAEKEEQQKQTVKYPANWWQGVKERWFPKWALKRWPVVYTVFTYSVKVLYPQLNVSLPNQTAVFMVSVDGPWEMGDIEREFG